ncbi:hypothetical protein YSY43_03130 [Paenibacillus sp. YSY-4.3]
MLSNSPLSVDHLRYKKTEYAKFTQRIRAILLTRSRQELHKNFTKTIQPLDNNNSSSAQTYFR